MRDQELGRAFFPSVDQDTDQNPVTGSRGAAANYNIPLVSDQMNMEEADGAYPNMLNELASFEVPPSLPSKQTNLPGEVSRSEEVISTGSDKGQSSGTKKTHASDSLDMQTKETDLQEEGPKEDPETSDACKLQKRTRSSEVHNLNERLRRQKLKEKMKALRELIPNCNKRDKASTLDDAIKYIKTLQHQVQMMSTGAGYSTFCSPLTMMQQQGQQRMQIPSISTLPSLIQTGPPRGGNTGEMEYGIGMGTSSVFSPLDFPMNQLGLPHPDSLPSSATSGWPGISAAAAAAHSVQDPGNLFEPRYGTSFPSPGSHSTTPGDTSSSQGAR